MGTFKSFLHRNRIGKLKLLKLACVPPVLPSASEKSHGEPLRLQPEGGHSWPNEGPNYQVIAIEQS